MFLKVDIHWDNREIETFRTIEQSMKENENLLVIENGGVRRVFNKRYIRKIEIIEE